MFQIIFALLYAVFSNSWLLFCRLPLSLYGLSAALLLIFNVLPILELQKYTSARLGVCRHGVVCLRAFLWTLPVDIAFHIVLLCVGVDLKSVIFSGIFCAVAETVIFWNGMLCVYCVSVQLGIKNRAVGILCGFVPILNIIQLVRIIRTVNAEIDFEEKKNLLNISRKKEEICKTKYPLLMVHGVFFRDFKFPPYWGRIPAELEKNGAKIFYGKHQSAASVADSAEELKQRIEEICNETDCEKVNVIAHSKGGLDIRETLRLCPEKIASVTTVNTPHKGCLFADFLLEKVPENMQEKIAKGYNAVAKKIGDKSPDFLAAVRDLTAEKCEKFDKTHPIPENIFCRSVGSVLTHPSGGKFPLNFTYRLAKYFDGKNDGLVSVSSCEWGDSHRLLEPTGDRGISHGDVIDLNRENIPGFDVREFYVELVSELKNKGL